MRILVDADACPVVDVIEEVAIKHGVPVILFADTSHIFTSDYSEVRVIDKGADAVDFAIMGVCKQGDIVVTQDYGVAAMALGLGVRAIHHSGKEYTNDNIEQLLMDRHIAKKERARGKRRVRKFTGESIEGDFYENFEKLIVMSPE